MIVNDKEWDKLKDDEKIAHCDQLFKNAKDSVMKRHFEWYLNYMFLDGNHYASYNATTNRIEAAPRKKGEVRIVVNKVKSNIRAVKNYCTRQEPKWEVIPGDMDDNTIISARRSGKFLDYLYRVLHLEQLVSGVVDSVLNTSVAWVELDWDENGAKGMGQIMLPLHDSFDVYPDPKGCLREGRFKGRFIAKALKRDMQAIYNDKRYIEKNRKLVKPDDNSNEASDIKTRLNTKESGQTEQGAIKRATVKEFMLYDEEKNSKGGNLRIFTYAGGQVLRDEEVELSEYNMYLMQIDMKPNKIYQRSWTADAIPLNKALDRAVSQKVMYVNQALIYRIIAEKGHGVEEVTNDMGVVYEVNKNRKWEQMAMHPLPSTLDSLAGEMGTYIEDVLGSHDASFGALPSGARSGKTVEALQAADSMNLAGIISSLNSFLAVLGADILALAAKKYVASRIIKLTEPEEGKQYMKVIGEKAPSKPKDAVILTEDNELIVKIGSWLGYTKEAQKETLMELVAAGVLPAEEVLRQLEFPNVEELSRKAREQRLEQHQLDAEIAGRTQGAQGQNEMVEMADKDMMDILNGADVPPTEGATPEHVQAERDFTQSNTFTQAPQELQQLILAHIQGEEEFLSKY